MQRLKIEKKRKRHGMRRIYAVFLRREIKDDWRSQT